MMIFGFLILLVLVVIGAMSMRSHGVCQPSHYHGHYGHWRDNHATPEEILRARYARGEISRDEFERMMQDLWR